MSDLRLGLLAVLISIIDCRQNIRAVSRKDGWFGLGILLSAPNSILVLSRLASVITVLFPWLVDSVLFSLIWAEVIT